MSTPVPLLRIKLSPEWIGRSGLWQFEPLKGVYLSVDADDLDLSDDLADRIEDWADTFDSLYDEAAPETSRFQNADDYAAFVAEGQVLATLIEQETDAEVTLEIPPGVVPLSGLVPASAGAPRDA